MEREIFLQKIAQLPRRPGIYLFRGALGEILYVGKAVNLRARAHSYLQNNAGKDLKTLFMLRKAADIDFMITDTEKEALILEDALIKEHQPRYNIKLRDDKHYPYLRFSPKEKPVLSIVRRVQKDQSHYFGPYPSAKSLRETVKVIQRVFPISTSLDTKFTKRLRFKRPERVSPNARLIKGPSPRYREVLRQVRMFLEGRNQDLIHFLRQEMDEEANRMNFEASARIRDQIKAINKVIEKQKIISREGVDRDVLGFSRKDQTAAIYVLFIRGGKLLGSKGFSIPAPGILDEEVLSSFLRQYYRQGNYIPRQILVSAALPDQALIESWLSGIKGKKVRLLVSRRGTRKRLLEMARENAENFLLPEGK